MSWLVFIIFNALMTSVLAITKCQATEKPRIPKDRLRVLIGCPNKFKKRRLNSSYEMKVRDKDHKLPLMIIPL